MTSTHATWQSALFAALLAIAAPALTAEKEPDAPRPNILFAIADDWGWPQAGAYVSRAGRSPVPGKC